MKVLIKFYYCQMVQYDFNRVESMIQITLLSWQIYVQKYPEEVEKNCWYKVWEKKADRIYAEIVLICVIQTTFILAI